MIGLGSGLNRYDGSTKTGDLSYYPLFRYYFEPTDRQGGKPSNESVAHLILAAQLLADLDPDDRDTRYYASQVMVLAAFWDANTDSIKAPRRIVSESFQSLLSSSGMRLIMILSVS